MNRAVPVSEYFPLPPNYEYTNPKYTVWLLNKLDAHDFDDHQFGVIHQFGDGTTIADHIEYCDGVGIFIGLVGTGNKGTQQRLEMVWKVLNDYAVAGFKRNNPELLMLLAKEAANELPPVRVRFR